MSAKDLFHPTVRRRLEKDRWHISNDPLELEWEEVKIKIDLAAERLIAVEIKSFISPSPISDFHTALGQFLNYRIVLEVKDPTRQLDLAIPLDTYNSFFQSRSAQTAIDPHQLKLIVYNPITEEIVQWIN